MNAAASEEPVDPSDELMFLALGGGNEVGRSCHIIQYKGKTVMVSLQPRKTKVQRERPADRHHSSMPVSIQPTTGSQPSRSTTISISARSTCS